MDMIPVCEPLLKGNELKYVTEAITTNWISSAGNFTIKLEEGFAKYCGTNYATTTSNGTTALHLACLAADLGEGDEVIVPDFTMISSAFAVCYTGALPVFVDCEPDTWNINPELIEQKITPRTKAIMVTHIYGHPCDMDAVLKIAKKHNLLVIEDAAEVHGATYHGKKCGSLADIACFSLFANKIITSGEGGLITTSNKELYDRCRYFKNLCFPLDGPRSYIHEDIGFNYRMPNTLAAIAFAQLERIDELVEMRRNNQAHYRHFLEGVPGLRFQPEKKGNQNVYWMVGVTVEESEFGMSRDHLMQKLKECKIETRSFFYPMHKQPSLLRFGCAGKGEYPVSTKLSQIGLYLPSSSGLSREQIEYVATTIRKIQQEKKR